MSLTDSQAYHRIVSSTLRVPTDPSVPVPVGLLACQRDPLLKELETYVITCAASFGVEASKDKKKKSQPMQQEGALFEVLLQDTILFPEGGGQPSDIGHVKGQDGLCWDVLEIKRRGAHAIHYVKGEQATLHSLAVGSRVTVALGEEGFKRRYDHMCMHTCQHLISALLEARLNLPTPSWYLTQSPMPAYIEVPRAPTSVELQTIEYAANACCIEGTRLHVEVEELDDSIRDNGDRNAMKVLPMDYTGGVNRTVVIDNVDRNPCCGTHLPTLQGLTVFILPQTEPLSRGRARIFFCAGPRVRDYLSQTHSLLTTAAATYGCAATQVPERLAFEADGRRKAHRRAEELENEVARFIVKDLFDECQRAYANDVAKHRFSAFRHRYDSSSNPLEFLSIVHSTWSASCVAPTSFLVVLVSSGVQSSSNNAVVLVFGSDDKEVKELGDRLKAKGIRGGGKAGKWSGKTDNWKTTGGDEWVKGLLDI